MSRLTVRSLFVLAAIALLGLALATVVRAATPGGYAWATSGSQTPSATSDSSSGGPVWSSLNPQAPAEGGPVDNSGQEATGSASIPANGVDGADVEAPGEPADNPQEQDLAGTIVRTDAAHSQVTLKLADGREVTIVASGQTEYGDGLSSAANLHDGMSVSVQGLPQQGGSIAATEIKGTVESDASPAGSDSYGSNDTSSAND